MSKPIQRYNILSDIVCYLLFFGNNFIVDIITSTKALVPNYEGSPTSEFSLMDGLSELLEIGNECIFKNNGVEPIHNTA